MAARTGSRVRATWSMTTGGNGSSAEGIVARVDPYDSPMPGELRPIGTRPKLVASFDPPGAADAYRRWREQHADALAGVPPESMRVEYGRAPGGGLFVRVRIDEGHLPQEIPSDSG